MNTKNSKANKKNPVSFVKKIENYLKSYAKNCRESYFRMLSL
ncbi:hypothetical protein [Cerina litoralis]|nr:hypothetical protein [Cerina litoralis]